jgi:hypothetical protein
MRGGAGAREQKRSSIAEGDYSTDLTEAQRRLDNRVQA